MPGHNAFQRNAFQRNAFQIVYDFVPTSTGGVVIGGGVTARFRVVGQFTPTSTGGVVVGGAVTARFTSGRPTRGLGSAGRPIWTRIFNRPKKYRPRVSSGVVVSGRMVARFTLGEVPVATSFKPRSSSGVVIGGGITSSFVSLPPLPPLEIVKPKAIPPTDYRPAVSLTLPVAGGGVKARFISVPPPPPPQPRIWEFAQRRTERELQRRIQEEDELLLLDLI